MNNNLRSATKKNDVETPVSTSETSVHNNGTNNQDDCISELSEIFSEEDFEGLVPLGQDSVALTDLEDVDMLSDSEIKNKVTKI